MSRLVVPQIETVESESNFGRFKVEPLEKGIGVTIGNAMRRILLGYLPGAAITWVTIEGVQHEFSTIPHMKEDTIEFLLNVKAIRIKAVSGRTSTLKLEVEGEGQVCAADIKPSEDFEIVNPELHMATLDTNKAKLFVEFNVEIGEGYREAQYGSEFPVGAIPVDAIFSPVRKVNYTIEPIHIGRDTSRERLYLEVWTDGTVSPVDAISQSASMLVEQISRFASYSSPTSAELGEETAASLPADERYNINIEDMDLSVRTMNALRRAGILNLGQLVVKSETDLMGLRNFGQKSRQEIVDKLTNIGLSLVDSEGGAKGDSVDQQEETTPEDKED
ncbi:DNA-directed RNA polymerase subunit alpha [Chloroflexota bacterium]